MTTRWRFLALAILLAVALPAAACNERRGGGSRPATDGGTRRDTGSGCSTAAQCDDAITCTDDRCEGGACLHQSVHTRCPMGHVCTPSMGGCQASTICATAGDCADTDPCTVEACDPATRLCTFDTLDGDSDGYPPLVCGGADCDDSNPEVHPGAPELCGDGIDNDCDRSIDPPGCRPAAGIGSPCTTDAECDVASGHSCATGEGSAFLIGVCTILDCDRVSPVDPCAPGVCVSGLASVRVCIVWCSTALDCAPPLACFFGGCTATCQASAECRPGWTCSGSVCVP